MKLLDIFYKKKYQKKWRVGIKNSSSLVQSTIHLNKVQKKEIKNFYSRTLGINIVDYWHEYFYKRNGLFSPLYIPTDLYYTTLIGKFNHYPFNEAYSDKCLTELILPDIPQPETVMKNVRGYFYIGGKPVTKEDAIAYCSNLNNVIIKPSMAAHGEGVRKFSSTNGVTTIDGMTVGQLFDKYQKHFLIQKVIIQHEDMKRLNPSSVNTIRVLTYRSGMEILVLYTVIRIGRSGFDVDNETAGGISTRINPDGTLCKFAYGAPGNDNVEKTDSGVVLEGYKIPSFEKAVEMVKKAHYLLPHFDLIGWDVAIQESGQPILIEWNTWPELSQTANGPAFGEYTERVLNEIKDRFNTRNANW